MAEEFFINPNNCTGTCNDSIKRRKFIPGYYESQTCCAGPSPYCAPGLSKFANCDNCTFNDPTVCNSCLSVPENKSMPECYNKEWTNVGYVYTTEIVPITRYLTKQCDVCDNDPHLGGQFGQCTGCRNSQSVVLEDKFHHQRRESAFENPTMFSNNGMGMGVHGSPLYGIPGKEFEFPGGNRSPGWNYGTLSATGCKCNKCNQDMFYHPKYSIQMPNFSRYFTLFARRVTDPRTNCRGRLQFAVEPVGRQNCVKTVLPLDPRQPPHKCGNLVDPNEQAWVELRSGDIIYIPGEDLRFNVHFWADDAGPFRPNHSVFRGWGPVRKMQGQVPKNLSNSGLRNLTQLGDAAGLLRPY